MASHGMRVGGLFPSDMLAQLSEFAFLGEARNGQRGYVETFVVQELSDPFYQHVAQRPEQMSTELFVWLHAAAERSLVKGGFPGKQQDSWGRCQRQEKTP